MTEKQNRQKHLYLIDGSGFIFRAYHALPPLTRMDGTPVNAVYGFTSMLLKILDKTDVDYFCVVFDSARRNFRHDIYSQYKANRPEPPEDLIPQFPLIREVCNAFNVAMIEQEGYEADDLIAAYVDEAQRNDTQVTIVSSDKDLMQLVRGGVEMLDPIKDRIIGRQQVIEKFGVPPEKVIEVQALAGDSVDNIPGIPGIGLKTAAELINAYGTVEELLARSSEIKQPKRRQSLIDHAEDARISKRLVALDNTAPLVKHFNELNRQDIDPDKALHFLKEQGFKTLISRLERQWQGTENQRSNNVNDQPKKEYELIVTPDHLKKWIKAIYNVGRVAVDTETTGLDPMQADLVGISLGLPDGKACYIPIAHKKAQQQLTLGDFASSESEALKQIPLNQIVDLLSPLMADPSVLKIGHNIKYDLLILARYGFNLDTIDDTMVMSYVLDGTKNGHGMDELAKLHLDYKTITFEEVAGTGKNQITFDYVDLKRALEYAAEDADITFRLHTLFKKRLVTESAASVYENIDRPLISVLKDMEQTGVKIDVNYLDQLGKEFQKRLLELEKEIHGLAGEDFNIGSPKQLGEVLYDKLKLPGAKKSKLGAYVTDADTLETLAGQGIVLAERVLDWRQLAKLKSTYTDALVRQINPKTLRLHTSYAMTITSTGRLSSSNPNLQNIPIRTEEGRKIRRAFIPEAGFSLMSLDYSQIELRLLACMADIESLKEAFRKGYDIHALTASEVFNVPFESVSPELRRQAKAINFGIIYGMSAFGLSQQLKISREEAGQYIKAYHLKYPGITQYMEATKENARRQGFVETMFGRKCYINSILDKNTARKNFAERQAINAPLQGSAADIIKIAMCHIKPVLTKENLKARMLLQVHDELIFEVPETQVELTAKIVKETMETAVRIDVPMIADIGIGHNWADAH